MRNIHKIGVSLLMAAGLTACSSETENEVKFSPELLNVERDVAMTAVETERQITVEADCHWEVSVDKSGWSDLTAQPLSGDGNGIITLTSSQNTAINERSASLIISSKGGLRQQITVRQTLGGATLEVNKAELSFDAIPSSGQSFTVTSNTVWSILGTDCDWLSIEPTSGGIGTTEIKVTASEIQDDRDREQTLTVALDNGTIKHDVVVKQAGKTNISLALSPESLEVFESTGGEQTVDIECNAQWYVDVPEKPDWLSISADGGIGNGKLTITCQPNRALETRFIRIYITSGTRTPKQVSLAVNQKAAPTPNKEDNPNPEYSRKK